MDKAYDVIIAGGGLSGVLAAARLATEHPHARILLLEREAHLGGRLRSTTASGTYSYGLNAISDQLYDFVEQTMRLNPDASVDLQALAPQRQSRMGVLAGNKMTSADINLWFAPKGARTLGGLLAAKQWPEIEEICRVGATAVGPADSDEDDEDELKAKEEAEVDTRSHPFAHYWKKPRKAPAAMVVEHFASAFGIPDVWTSSPQALSERAAFHSSRLHSGSWDHAIMALTELPAFMERVTVKTGSVIADASHDGEFWRVNSETGIYRSRALVVAQSPWQAVTWLKRALWPAHLLQIPSKTKPVSVVVLSDRITHGATEVEIPDVIVVPSERVQIVRNGAYEICFQATIDFELSLQAPAVVKAVRSLKRARKKLLTLYPGLVTEGNHIALQPVAWAQSPSQTDRRWFERLDKKNFQSKRLAFCGDAYGAHYDGDSNVVKSLLSACQAIGAGIEAPADEPMPSPASLPHEPLADA